MQHASVKELFKEQVRIYSHKDQYTHSPLVHLILGWLKDKKINKKIEICEFGGGAGQLLGEIRKSYPDYSYTNVEIIKDYKQYLVSKKIVFVIGSILNSHFHNNSFDVLIIRDVLHHLVGENYEETADNQKLALNELKRLVKPKGVIFIEELTNESEIATKIIYYLSKLNSKVGISIPSLQISSNIIVAFLTDRKLLDLCSLIFGRDNIKEQVLNLETKWYIALLHLFGRLEKTIITAKKQ